MELAADNLRALPRKLNKALKKLQSDQSPSVCIGRGRSPRFATVDAEPQQLAPVQAESQRASISSPNGGT
jgi:hypothetical protein